MTAAGIRAIRKEGFVKSQLKHYGIQYDEREFTGNGVILLKKRLEAGQFDTVPASILDLEQQLRREWVGGRKLGDLVDTGSGPDELVNFYFLDSTGNADKTTTPDGLAVPLPRHSEYRASLLTKAIGKVPGLMSRREGDTMLVAWDDSGIAKAREAGQAAAREAAEALKRKDEARVQSRTDRHESYLHSLDSKAGKVDHSPAGKYLLHCEGIENEWPETKKVDMSLDIRMSGQTGIYEASFDVGVAEGPMQLSTDQDALEKYIVDLENSSQDDEDDEDSDQDDENSDEDEASELENDDSAPFTAAESIINADAAHKRKGSERTSGTTKKSKPTSTLHFYTAYKSRETGEGEIDYEATSGYLTFKNDQFSTFSASLDLNFTSGKVVDLGRKISDVGRVGEDWEDYSGAAYEYARVARWR